MNTTKLIEILEEKLNAIDISSSQHINNSLITIEREGNIHYLLSRLYLKNDDIEKAKEQYNKANVKIEFLAKSLYVIGLHLAFDDLRDDASAMSSDIYEKLNDKLDIYQQRFEKHYGRLSEAEQRYKN